MLHARGRLDAATVASQSEEVTETVGGLVAVRRFVDALKTYVEEQDPGIGLDEISFDDEVMDQYLTVCEITRDSITFDDHEDTVGPVPVPPEICAMAEKGWQILLTAARVEGRWVLLNVVNGSP